MPLNLSVQSEDLSQARFVVVGSGFFGSVIAERIANELDQHVVILEKRNHFGGNSYSERDSETGIEFHKYGSHIFHTNNESVWHYVNRFGAFNEYRHRVLTQYNGRVFSMPINLMTINQFYGRNLSPGAAREFILSEIARDRVELPANLEEQAISLIGRPLYEAFIRGYTQKQWETDLTQLPPNIITRLPVRFNYDDRYFSDKYEGIPIDGYAALFKRVLTHPKIEVRLGIDYFDVKGRISPDALVVYTGPIDRYFDFRLGDLGWRTIDLDRSVENVSDFQGTSVMNFADSSVPFTRIHEFKHFHPERKYPDGKTLIFREFSRFAKRDELPYYPINTDKDRLLYSKYRELASKEINVIFGGRLGTYKYFDMHQAIGAALLVFDKEIKPKVTGVPYRSRTEKMGDLSDYL
jgi:UDP-galactopyranose mutase